MTSRDLFARSRELRLKLAKDVTTQAATTPLPPPTTTEASSDSQDAANNLSFGMTSSPRTSSSRPMSSSGRGTDSDSSFHYVNSNVTESPVSVSKVPVLLASEGFRIKGAAEAVASWKKDTEGEFGSSANEEASSFVTAPSSCKSLSLPAGGRWLISAEFFTASENIVSSSDPSPIPTPASTTAAVIASLPLTPTSPLLSTASSKFPDIAKPASIPSSLPQSSTSLADLSIATGKSEIDHAEISKWKGLYESAVRSKESLKTELEGKLEISEGVRVGIQDELKKLLISNSASKEELDQMKGKADELEVVSQENKRCLDEAIGEILRQEEEGARLEEELKRSIADFEEKKLELQEKHDEIQTIKDVAAKSTAELLEKHLQDLQRCNSQIKQESDRRQELEKAFSEMGGIVDHLQKEMDKLTSDKDLLATEKVSSDHGVKYLTKPLGHVRSNSREKFLTWKVALIFTRNWLANGERRKTSPTQRYEPTISRLQL